MRSFFSKRRLTAVVLACVFAPALGSAQAPRLEPLPVRELVAAPTFALFSPVQLSPDGRWVAYTLADPQRAAAQPDASAGEGRDVWVADARGGRVRNISAATGEDWNGVWSDDGTRLAFLSNRSGQVALWLWEPKTDRLRQASAQSLHVTSAIAWVDNKSIVVKIAAEGLDEAPPAAARERAAADEKRDVVTAVVFRSESAQQQFGEVSSGALAGQPPSSPPTVADLAVIDLSTGGVRRLTRGVDAIDYSVAPDGHAVAYRSRRASSDSTTLDIGFVPVAGGEARVLAQGVKPIFPGSLSWSPDAKQIAYTTTDSEGRPQLSLVRAAGGEPRVFALGPKIDDEMANGTTRTGRPVTTPLWNAASDTIAVLVGNALWRVRLNDNTATPLAVPGHLLVRMLNRQTSTRYSANGDERSVLILVCDPTTQAQGIATLDLITGRSRVATHADVHYGGGLPENAIDVSADGRRVAFLREDSQHAPDIWIGDAWLRSPKRLTRVNPWLEQYAMGRSRLISWPARDGQTRYGALLLPPGHRDGDRHPLVVVVYGGVFFSRVNNAFGMSSVDAATENYQVLATRGYAVLMPDLPVGPGNPMADIAEGIDAAAARAVELGYADPKRLGLTGHSYGGYSTLAALVLNPERFAAAVARAGASNLTTQYAAMDASGNGIDVAWAESGQGRMAATLWEHRDRYINNSPLFFLDRVRTPLLLIHGADDDAVVPTESAQVFVGLRRLGKAVEYARYGGENHWEAGWSAANQMDYWERVLRWFQHYLGAGETK